MSDDLELPGEELQDPTSRCTPRSGDWTRHLHDQLLATYPDQIATLRLRVLEGNLRGRRFYEKLGWNATGVTAPGAFPPHPMLLEYTLDRRTGRGAG